MQQSTLPLTGLRMLFHSTSVGTPVGTALIAAACFALPFSTPAESFDKPTHQRIVNLGRSQYLMPDSPGGVQLSCFYYPAFLIKQLNDPGVKGAVWITVTPVKDRKFPACRKSHSVQEKFLDRDRTGYLAGYFGGVKEDLVFLDASDGLNGATAFRVLDWKTGRAVFEDSARNNVQFAHDSSGSLTLRYSRSVEAVCSIPKDGASCWSRIRQRFHLASSAIPKCVGYKGPGVPEWTPEHPVVPLEDLDTPSAVAYPVTVTLFPHPVTTPMPGRVICSALE